MLGDLSRRDVIRGGVAGAAGVMMGGSLLAAGESPATQPTTRPGAKAKSVIQVWLWGGPCHIDTFDPKPEAGRDYCGPLDKPIETNVSGIRIGELLPLLAQQADKYSLIRSMTHGNDGHETAAYMVQTGRKPGDGLVYPSFGAIVSLFKGQNSQYTGLIPPYIVLTEPQGRFSEAGFLGAKYKPFATGGNPAAAKFVVEGVSAEGISDERQQDRRELLDQLNTLGQSVGPNARLEASAKARKEAYDLILGDEGKIFDLGTEKEEVRTAYGMTKFGQSCLMARRLVERGLPYVTINFGGWDTHKGHFGAMRGKLPDLDKGLSQLLVELSERGLLESTIVWCCGEFGRTPKVDWQPPWEGGRGHFGRCFSALVAGGGFKGGQVVGTSDARGESVKDRPVYPADLMGSMCDLLGIDPTAKLPHPQGKEVSVVAGANDGVPMAGRLKEIM